MDDMQRKIKNGEAILVDVRTEDEWSEAHAVGAVHIPIDTFSKNFANQLDKQKEIYVYCGSGKRASAAKLELDTAGYTVRNIGGLSDWVRLGGGLDPKS